MNLFKSKIDESAAALVKLQESYDALNEDFAKASAEITEANQLAATFKAEFERVCGENEALKLELEASKQEAAEVTQEAVELDDKAALKAVVILAEAGHAPVEVLDAPEPTLSITEQFKKLKGAERNAFYNEHKAEIHKSLRA